MKVVGSIVTAAGLDVDRAAVGEDVGVDHEIASAPGDVDCAVVDDPVAGIAAALDVRVAGDVDRDAGRQGQDLVAGAGRVVFVQEVVSARIAEIDRVVADGLRIVEIERNRRQ